MKKTPVLLLLIIFTLTAFAADGDLDASFDADGKVSTDLGTNSDTAWEVVAQPDGKIVLIGTDGSSRVCLVRYNIDGSLDQAFGTSGKAILASSFDGANTFGFPYSAALQADEKFIIGSRSAGSFPQIIRVNANGSLDTTFGTSGYVRVRTNGNAEMSSIEEVMIQADGKILLGGYGYTNSPLAFGFTVARLNANGSFDTTFGTGGMSVISFDAGIVANTALAMASNGGGKIAVSGFRFNTGSETGFLTLTRVAVFNADGSPDSTFGTGGKISLPMNDERRPNAVAFQADGKIVIGGTTDDRGAEAIRGFFQRFTTSGAVDATFGTNGLAIVKINNRRTEFNDIAIQPDGKILGFGQAVDLPTLLPSFVAVRHLPNGAPDTAFGTNGFRTTIFTEAINDTATAYSGVLQTDGKIVAGGVQSSGAAGGGLNNFAAVRYLNSGSNPPINNPALRIADFDGDGKTDICVFRDGVWYMRQSSSNQIRYQTWGLNSDTLAAGDYDGDGKTDVTIWRNGIYYVLSSGNSSVNYQYFGSGGDKVIASAFIQ